MSKGKAVENRTEELLAPIAEENGVEIYDVEYLKEGSDWYLRAYIDKPEGVNIQDCENVSRAKKWNCGFISPGISRRNLRVS